MVEYARGDIAGIRLDPGARGRAAALQETWRSPLGTKI